MSRESPLLPRSDAREAALFFVIAALCFLAVLASLTARGTYSAAEAWTAQVQGQLTVRLQETSDARADEAASIIKEVEGVTSARVLQRGDLETLLEPSFGTGGLPDGLPLPVLIAVESTGDVEAAVAESLESEGYGVTIDSHGRWAGDVKRALATLRIAALGAVLLLAATAIAVIAFATHAALLARRDVVDVLHISGAEDRFIAGLFEQRFWGLALRAGLAGAVAALVAAALIIFSAQSSGARSELLPSLTLDIWDFAILIATPVLSAFAARTAARFTVLRALKAQL